MDIETLLQHLHVNTIIHPGTIEVYQSSLERMTDEQRDVVWEICQNGGSLYLGHAAAWQAIDSQYLPPKPDFFALRTIADDSTVTPPSTDDGAGES